MRKALDPTPPLLYTSSMSDTITLALCTTNGIVFGDTTISFDNHRTDVLEQIKAVTGDQPFQCGTEQFRIRTGEHTLLLQILENTKDRGPFWDDCSLATLRNEVRFVMHVFSK